MTLAQAVAALRADVTPALRNAAIGIAFAVQNEIAPYPPAPPTAGRRVWYERGYGPRWRTRDGAVHGRNTSQTMNRRWMIQATGTGAVLGNSASYAKYAHASASQSSTLAKVGWVTDRVAVGKVAASGVVEKILVQALAAAFRGKGA